MSAGSEYIYGPIYYEPSWLLLGLGLLLLAAAIIGLILFATRKKEVKSLKTLPIQQTKKVDMDALKKMHDLLEAGIITQAEFDAKKKQLLGI